MSKRKVPAIAKPSDLLSTAQSPRGEVSGSSAGSAPAATSTPLRADLPPVMALELHGGEAIKLKADQVFADRVVIRAGEKGRAMYPSSQAASWVVLFPRVGAKLRVIPEHLLELVDS